MLVQINQNSQKLIIQYQKLVQPYLGNNLAQSFLTGFNADTVSYEILITWLNSEPQLPVGIDDTITEEIKCLINLLRAELLHDLFLAMVGGYVPGPEEEPNSRTADKVRLFLLALAGTILAASNGFDAATTLLGFTAISPVVVLFIGTAFSVLSIIIFYGYDLVQVSKNLGVNLSDAPKLLDVYLAQLKEIKSIRKKINTYNLLALSSSELKQLEMTVNMLTKRLVSLNQASQQFELALNTPTMHVIKLLFTGVAGLLFFGSGFFAGQSVALFMVGFFATTLTTTLWPVILFSLVVGTAALSLFWYVERVGLTKLISGWFGLDEEKIEYLCDKQRIAKETFKLENLKEKIQASRQLLASVGVAKQIKKEEPKVSFGPLSLPKLASNVYSMFFSEEIEPAPAVSVECFLNPR